jgi:hypothetical protein
MTKRTTLTALVLATLLAAPAAQAQQIGTVASLEPNMQATAPGQAERRLSVNAGVVANDSIRTAPSARGQLLFNDQTTLSVAPASQIVLDRFVYDPSGGGSGFSMKLTTGALRFVGGATSEAQEAVIVTPTATLGIRGSSALVSHRGGRTVAVFLIGERMCVTAGGQRSCTSRQGGVLTENGYAGKASPALLANLLGAIDGTPPTLVRRGPVNAGVSPATSPGRPVVSSTGRTLTELGPDTVYLLNDGGGILDTHGVIIDDDGGDIFDEF